MTILITGGAGYIGSHTVYEFLDNGHEVVVADDLSTGHREVLPPGLPFYLGNVGDAAFMDTVFAKHKIDAVIHFAGSIIVPESVSNPLKYYQNNTGVSRNLLESCVRHGVGNFIFSSTASVYGENPLQIMKEDFAPAPCNPYASSKLMTEMMIQDAARAHGMNYVILRYFNVAGADMKGRTGQIGKNATHLIKVACELAQGKRQMMEVFGTDYDTRDGTCIRDYIHVTDLANAHLKSYDHMKKNKQLREIFNCGYGTGYSVLEVISALESLLGRSLNKKMAGRRAGDPPALVADCAKIKAHTGWTPRHDRLETILQSALAWEKIC